MAMLLKNNYNNSSSNYYRKTSSESSKRSNTQASAYVVDASSMALNGLHFSTSGGRGAGESCRTLSCGAFEVGSGPPSPPPSPASARLSRPTLSARKRSGDAAYHIKEECERLFCETLKTVFLVEKDASLENSLVTDMRNNNNNTNANKSNAVQIPPPKQQRSTFLKHNLPTPSPSPDGRVYPGAGGLVKEYVEVWDYTAGARFRGFVAEKEDERCLFIFFDDEVVGSDLKPGLMALLELASEGLDCGQIIGCVDRAASKDDFDDITRDLGWVGFTLTTLDAFAGTKNCISDRWLFLEMDV